VKLKHKEIRSSNAIGEKIKVSKRKRGETEKGQ
jgi:hypothetical protein